MKMRATGIIAAAVLGAAALTARADLADARFYGGAYDGWGRGVMASASGLGGAVVTLSSGANQLFDFTAASGALAAVTLTVENPSGVITNGGALRIVMPPACAAWRFATNAVVSYGGSAANKVGAAGYLNGGRAVNIPVTSDFAAGDTLVISGLGLSSLWLMPPGSGNLGLDINGDGALDATDAYTLTVRALWSGGAYDGWDSRATAQSMSLMPPPKGTALFIF